MIKVAVLGLGSRGKNYGGHLAKMKNIAIVSVCDKFQNKIDKVKTAWNVPDSGCFTSDEEFFAQGKVADAIIIATQDRDHYGHAMKALELGYNIIMEKPVSPFIGECLEIERTAREKGLKVLVCHVLRYAPYYRRVKEMIDSGVLGDIITIKHDENISYWHFAHSYVRGNWRREEETSPMLLAKCCHDMDILHWYTGSKFKKLNSYGDLRYFKAENAPEGSAAACNIENFVYILPNIAGSTLLTFLSQNVGAKKYSRIELVVKTALIIGFVLTLIAGIFLAIFGRFLMGLYSKEADIIELGAYRLMFIGPMMWMEVFMTGFSSALKGLGKAKESMLISVCAICGFRILWLNTVFLVFHTYTVILLSWPVSWVLITAIYIIYYKKVRDTLPREDIAGI